MQVLILGSDGFLGRNLGPSLKTWITDNSLGEAVLATRKQCDLQSLSDVRGYLEQLQPHTIINLAGKVGGFLANKQKPADIGLTNLQINVNLLVAARETKVNRIINFVGSCSYPAHIKNAIKEADLGNGSPDPTSAAYAVGKTAIHQNLMAMNYQDGMKNITFLPANVYGPFDHFDPVEGHVVPALIQKIHAAKIHDLPHMQMIGSGHAKRDFLFAPDMLAPIKRVLNAKVDENIPSLLNIGTGCPTSIKSLARVICDVVGYSGELFWENSSENDGQNVKYLDCSLMNSLDFDFQPTDLFDGITQTYRSYLATC